MDWHTILSFVFLILLGFAVTMYAILDGFDLGVGMLMPRATSEEQNSMVASIGPFWDANETWLVLVVGVLFIIFPAAHSLILGALYLPVTFMLLAIMVRGVAFDFRVKARPTSAFLEQSLSTLLCHHGINTRVDAGALCNGVSSRCHRLFVLIWHYAVCACGVCAIRRNMAVAQNRRRITRKSTALGQSSMVSCDSVFAVGVAGIALCEPKCVTPLV